MSETVMTGTTIRVKSTFRAFAPSGSTGALQDADGDVDITIYDNDEISIDTGTSIALTTGIYYYDWTVPDVEGNYFIEFKGDFDGKPELNRKRYKAKFEPVEES